MRKNLPSDDNKNFNDNFTIQPGDTTRFKGPSFHLTILLNKMSGGTLSSIQMTPNVIDGVIIIQPGDNTKIKDNIIIQPDDTKCYIILPNPIHCNLPYRRDLKIFFTFVLCTIGCSKSVLYNTVQWNQ